MMSPSSGKSPLWKSLPNALQPSGVRFNKQNVLFVETCGKGQFARAGSDCRLLQTLKLFVREMKNDHWLVSILCAKAAAENLHETEQQPREKAEQEQDSGQFESRKHHLHSALRRDLEGQRLVGGDLGVVADGGQQAVRGLRIGRTE